MNEEIDRRLAVLAKQLSKAESGVEVLLIQTKIAELKAMRD